MAQKTNKHYLLNQMACLNSSNMELVGGTERANVNGTEGVSYVVALLTVMSLFSQIRQILGMLRFLYKFV